MPRLGQRKIAASRAMTTGLAVSALAAGVAFLTNIVMSRQLGPGPRGEVAFVLQLSYMLTPIVLLGVDRQQLRHGGISGDQRLPSHLTVACLTLTAASLAIFRDWQALVGPIVYVLAALTVLRCGAFRENSFRWYVGCMVGYQLVICAGSLILYFLDVDNWVAWTIPYALPAVVLLAAVAVKQPNAFMPRRIFLSVSSHSLTLLPAGVAAVVVTRLDRVLLGVLSTDAQLGLYIAVATATEVLAWLANSLADHRVARYDPHVASRRDLVVMLSRDSLIFGPLAVVAAFAIWLGLLPMLGPEFSSGAGLIAPLCLSAVALALYRQAVSWNLGSAKPKRATILESATASFAVPAYVLGVAMWGALGAAWSSLLVYSVGCSLGILVARRTGSVR